MRRKTDKTTHRQRLTAFSLGHRAIHGTLAVADFATLVGLDKHLVQAVIGRPYLALTFRG